MYTVNGTNGVKRIGNSIALLVNGIKLPFTPFTRMYQGDSKYLQL